MKVIAGYDTAKAAIAGENEQLPAGVYSCVIKNATETISKNGFPMLVLDIDIDNGEYNKFFTKKHEFIKKANYNDAATKWPCCYYQRLDGDHLSYFKGMMHAIEDSNDGYKWDWNERGLIGLNFAGVFGREEVKFNDGKIAMLTKLVQIRSYKAWDEGCIKVPKDKMLAANSNAQHKQPEVESFNEDDIPF